MTKRRGLLLVSLECIYPPKDHCSYGFIKACSRHLSRRHPREILPLSREVARAEADVVRRVLGLDALHVFDLPLTAESERLVPVSR